MKRIFSILIMLVASLTLTAQNKPETYEPAESVYDASFDIASEDGNVVVSGISKDWETCTLHFEGISLRKAQNMLVDYSIKSRTDSKLGGYAVYYDKTTKVYSAYNEHLLEPILMIESTRVDEIRKYFKTDEMLAGLLGVL